MDVVIFYEGEYLGSMCAYVRGCACVCLGNTLQTVRREVDMGWGLDGLNW